MPKLSVSVPDSVWQDAKESTPNAGASQLVQEALREFVDRRESRPYAVLSPELVAARASAVEQSLAKRAAAYQAGYAIGLKFAESLTWELFTLLEQVQWKLPVFHEETEEDEYLRADAAPGEPDQRFRFEDAWHDARESAAPGAYVNAEGPAGVIREGFLRALKDVWSAEEPLPEPTPQFPAPALPDEPATDDAGPLAQESEGESDA